MNDPNQPLESPPYPPQSVHQRGDGDPDPFRRNPEKTTSGGGCSKPLLVGCSVLLVLLGLGAVLFLMNADRFMVWAFDRMETEISDRLPEDIPAAERQRLSRAFDALVAAAHAGTLDPVALQAAQGDLQVLASKEPEKITVEDVRRAARGLEAAAGVEVEE